jgi:hypothetical protein
MVVFSFALVSCGSDDNGDDQSPTVSITYPPNGYEITDPSTITVTIEASDNKGISEVDLMIDGTLFGTDNDSPYTFEVDFAEYDAGAHSLTAKARDRSGNEAVSATISVIWESFDFAPDGNGLLMVKVVRYREDGEVDSGDNDGDPYFQVRYYHGADTLTQQSPVFANTFELNNPWEAIFDIDDHVRECFVEVYVIDEDEGVDHLIDYTPEAENNAYRWTVGTDGLDATVVLNGSEDGVPDEPDCTLELHFLTYTEGDSLIF